MVKITGRKRGQDHVRAHLEYISRHGALPLEGRDGELLESPGDLFERAAAWAADDRRPRKDSATCISFVLSMPPGTPAIGVRDAARAFASEVFADRHDYLFALHTDADHPHVHLTVKVRGRGGDRLNPRKGDLCIWRSAFARHLRDHSIDAEATHRRARGVCERPERFELRKLRERHERDPSRHAPPRVWSTNTVSAEELSDWRHSSDLQRHETRRIYGRAAEMLIRSADPTDVALGRRLSEFVERLAQAQARFVGNVRGDPPKVREP